MLRAVSQPGVIVSERLVEKNGMYTYRSFYGKDNSTIYTIASTEMPKKNSAVMSAIDTFINENGRVWSSSRGEIVALVDNGKLKPVLTSLITTKGEIKLKTEKTKKSKK